MHISCDVGVAKFPVSCREKEAGTLWGGPQHPARVGDSGQQSHLFQLQPPGLLSSTATTPA